MRAALLAAVLLLAACTGASPTPSGEAVRILATDLSLAEEPYAVFVIDNPADYETAWARSSRSAAPPDVSFDSEVVVYLGMAGSSSCPETFQHLVVDDAAAHVYGEWSNIETLINGDDGVGPPKNIACTDDLSPQGIVLAVNRAVLPAGEFTLTLREQLVCPDCPDHPDQEQVSLP